MGRSGSRFGYVGAVVLIAVAFVFAVGMLAGCGGEAVTEPAASTTEKGVQTMAVGLENTITVTGQAQVTSAPDEAVLTIAVDNEGADPGAALNTNSESIKKVVDRLKQEGLEESAIETASVTVYPNRTYDPKTGKESLTGYRAQNTVTVTLKDALQVGKVFAAAVETGATNVSGPEWRLSEDSAAVTEALKKAVANARTKAEAGAEAEGLKLGEVIMMTEGQVQVPVVPLYGAFDEAFRSSAATVAEPPISPAGLDVTASITVTYTLAR